MTTCSLKTYCFTWDERAHCPVWLLVGCQTMFKSKASLAPIHVLTLVNVRAELLDVEGVIPIDHVLAHIVPFLEMSTHSRIAVVLDVEWMRRVPRTDYVLESVSLFKFQVVNIDEVFKDTLTALILSNILNQLVDDPLEILVGLVTKLAVAVKVHEVFHTLTLRIACLADKCEE